MSGRGKPLAEPVGKFVFGQGASGHRIVAQLEAHGLNAAWDGHWEQRIGVTMEWKKRHGVPMIAAS